MLGRAIGSILSRNGPSDKPGTIHKPGIAFAPLMVIVTMDGQLEERWINCHDTWRELRGRLRKDVIE